MTDTAAASAKLVWGLLTPNCYDVIFNKQQFFNLVCLKLVISKLLSYAIIAGSTFLKVPQILKIYPSGSVTGLAPSMFVIETFGYSITILYNYRMDLPLSTYAEAWIIWLQDLLIVWLIYFYSNKVGATFVLSSLAYFGLFFAGMSGYVSTEVISILFSVNIGVFAASRIPQIVENFKNQSTGKLALVSIAMAFVGGLARIFTTLQEVSDSLVLMGFVSGTFLNGVLLFQILLYWNNTQAQEKSSALLDAKKKRK